MKMMIRLKARGSCALTTAAINPTRAIQDLDSTSAMLTLIKFRTTDATSAI